MRNLSCNQLSMAPEPITFRCAHSLVFMNIYLYFFSQICNWMFSWAFAWIQVLGAYILHTEVMLQLALLIPAANSLSCISIFESPLSNRTAGNASEESLDRLPTSATCMNLLKLPPYRRFVQVYPPICKVVVPLLGNYSWEFTS